jgi:Trk-type K+ transport system membrane component
MYVQYMCVCFGINTKIKPTERFMAVHKLQLTWRKYTTVIGVVCLKFILVNLLFAKKNKD